MSHTTSESSAVVIGAGIAGLTAAAALASRLKSVVIVDRDQLPDTAAPRRGVPQSAHAHLLLKSGFNALEGLFPGLFDELVAAGGIEINAGRDAPFFQFGARRAPHVSPIDVLSFTRPMLEGTVRARLAKSPHVSIRWGTQATALRPDDQGRVRGVTVQSESGTEDLGADLVVDAMGRGAGQANRWLAAIGYPVPDVSTVSVGVGYATREYRRETGETTPMLITLSSPPEGLRAGVLFPVEGDRWVVTLAGWHDDHPPADDEGFAAFAASLPEPTLAATLSRLKPITDIRLFQFPASRWRHFERLRRVPSGYLAIGDALCSFNPLYGQGMSVSALEAELLGHLVDRHGLGDSLPQNFYRAAAKVISVPWQMATGADFVYPQTKGKRPFAIDLLNSYTRKVVLAAHVRPEINDLLLRVTHMLTPMSALTRPATVARVLRAARKSPAIGG